jgi:hypothetical protein
MDPNENLRRQLAIARAAVNVEGADDTLVELSELVLALDEWMRLGSFLPARWANAQHRPA